MSSAPEIQLPRIDNGPLVPGEVGWVDQFHRALETRVSQLPGEKVRIWRDPKLQGNDGSDSWTEEPSEFLEATQKSNGPSIGNRSRVFTAFQRQLERGAQPGAAA